MKTIHTPSTVRLTIETHLEPGQTITVAIKCDHEPETRTGPELKVHHPTESEGVSA